MNKVVINEDVLNWVNSISSVDVDYMQVYMQEKYIWGYKKKVDI